jgi:uncharacterized membrane protein
MRPTILTSQAITLFLILVGASGCVRYVERTTCPAACGEVTTCGIREGDRYSMRWPVATAIAGVVALGAGGTMLHAGRAEHEALERELEAIVTMQGDRPFQWDPAREDRALFLQNAGSVLIGAGVVALVAATVLYFHQKKPLPVVIRRVDP